MHTQSIKTKLTKLVLFALILIVLLNFLPQNDPILSPFPNGKNFAFTITDDPDGSKLEQVQIVYDFVHEIGMRTTLAVWTMYPSPPKGDPRELETRYKGVSCDDKEYLKYVQGLQKKGFEIAMHTATAGNDLREDTIKSYERFKQYFGEYPQNNIMHSRNLENIYWGKKVINNKILQYIV